MEVGVKLILLDERDVFGDNLPSLEDLQAAVEFTGKVSPDWQYHYLDHVGFVSERFNRSEMFEGRESDGLIMKYAPSWLEFLVNHLSPYAGEDMSQFFAEGYKGYVQELRLRLNAAVERCDYRGAEMLCSALLGVEQSGLPGFRRDLDVGDDPYRHEMIDARGMAYWPGRRLILEACECA